MNTLGRRSGKLSDAEEALWTVRQKGELSDKRLIDALLDMTGIPTSGITKVRAHGGVLFGSTQVPTERMNLYDTNGVAVPNLDFDPQWFENYFHQMREARRNRWAFGFIALAYVVQAVSMIAT
jgi:hypothetical protein